MTYLYDRPAYPLKGIENIPIEEGEHTVRILIGNTADETEWTYEGERSLEFKRAERRMVLFDRVGGFTWH